MPEENLPDACVISVTSECIQSKLKFVPPTSGSYSNIRIKLSCEEERFRLLQGPVSFRNRQRRAETVLSQYQLGGQQQSSRTIAEYSHVTGFNQNCSKCQPLIWPGKHPVTEDKVNLYPLFLQAPFPWTRNEMKSNEWS